MGGRSPASNDGSFEFFRVRRLRPRTLIGGRDRANSLEGRPAIHLATIDYSSSPGESPLSAGDDGRGGELADLAVGWFGRSSLGVFFLFLAWAGSVRAAVRGFSVRTFLSAGVRSLARTVVGKVLVEIICIENGFVGGICESTIDIYPARTPWGVRVLVYSFVGFKMGLRGVAAKFPQRSRLGALCGPRSRENSTNKGPTDSPSEYDEDECCAGLVFLEMGRKFTSLPQWN